MIKFINLCPVASQSSRYVSVRLWIGIISCEDGTTCPANTQVTLWSEQMLSEMSIHLSLALSRNLYARVTWSLQLSHQLSSNSWNYITAVFRWVDGLVYRNTKMQNNIVWITVVNNVMPIILCCVTTTAILVLLKIRQRAQQGAIDK